MEADVPKTIKFDSTVVDLCFHPHKNVIAAGDIDGDVTVYSYSTVEENHLLLTLPHHKKSCRVLRFSPSGERLVTASKDKSIQVVDMDTGTVKQNIKKAHEVPLYSLLIVDENIVASGDDDGYFKVWDLRLNKTVMEMKENDEFISDMVIDDNNRVLIASSGDGTLSAFDIRKHKLKLQSELFDSELLSIAKVKNGEKIVCGTGEGAINIFNWGEWGNLSDRFPGHPMSVDCIIPLNDDIIVTGSIDGIIRAVNILPNRFMGVVGEHVGFPIENMAKSRCSAFLATCSHDECIKFWDIKDIEKEKVSTKRKAKKSTKKKLLTKAAGKKNDFFSDLSEEAGTSRDKDDSDEGERDSDDSSDDDNTMQSDGNREPSSSEPPNMPEENTFGIKKLEEKGKNKEDYDKSLSEMNSDDDDLLIDSNVSGNVGSLYETSSESDSDGDTDNEEPNN